MNNELAAIDWLARGWLLTLAFTAAVLLVAALRKPCRRLFGTERAFQLWLLPPLAMLASQLPHAAAPLATMPPLVIAITSVADAFPAYPSPVHRVDWRTLAMLIWFAGSVTSLSLAAFTQQRYRRCLRGATSLAGTTSRWPVLRALSTDVGPALVGAWHVRIVVPVDFEQRYNADERVLILAHEAAHARRRDGWSCLLAQMTAALCWFNPLSWWALAALRQDQELACDAVVLREFGEQRRNYANAMLKAQSAVFALPVGCPWSPRHPLTERIAMLKYSSPNRRRKSAGLITWFAVAMFVMGSIYAASTPPPSQVSNKVSASEYQLQMQVELFTDDGHKRHAQTVDFALCTAPGEAAMANVGSLTVQATAVPVHDRHVRINLAVGNIGASPVVHSQLDGVLGQTLHSEGKGVDGKHSYAIDITPQTGCPARVLAEASPIKVTEHITHGTTRAVAESIAAKAGWTLTNPEAVGQGAVTLSFNDMPAGTALQQVADLAGMTLVLDGARVRFSPK